MTRYQAFAGTGSTSTARLIIIIIIIMDFIFSSDRVSKANIVH